MSKYLATIIDYFNHDASISNIMVSTYKLQELLTEYNSHMRKALRNSEVDSLE